MVTNKKVTGVASSLPGGIGLGLLLSVAVTLLGCALIAYLMVTQKLQEDAIGFTSMTVQALASLSGSWLAAAKVKRMRVQVCMIAGAVYYLFLLACTALFVGGQYTGMGVTALIVFLCCGCTAVFGMINQKGVKSKMKKPAYR